MAAPLAEWFTPFEGSRAIPDPWVVENLRGYEIVGESEWGNYRIIYEIADEVRIVRVYRVRHRREVYR